MNKKMGDNKAITLIALVITIVVILILAGVSVSTLTGNNGLIGLSKNEKEDLENKQHTIEDSIQNLEKELSN